MYLAISAVTATPGSFAPFGQVLKPEEDGMAFDERLDAQLDGLGNGTPRLYLMRLEGPRPLAFDRITHHKAVTQCLGALGNTPEDADFYLAVHAPSDEVTMEGIKAFRVAPHQLNAEELAGHGITDDALVVVLNAADEATLSSAVKSDEMR